MILCPSHALRVYTLLVALHPQPGPSDHLLAAFPHTDIAHSKSGTHHTPTPSVCLPTRLGSSVSRRVVFRVPNDRGSMPAWANQKTSSLPSGLPPYLLQKDLNSALGMATLSKFAFSVMLGRPRVHFAFLWPLSCHSLLILYIILPLFRSPCGFYLLLGPSVIEHLKNFK